MNKLFEWIIVIVISIIAVSVWSYLKNPKNTDTDINFENINLNLTDDVKFFGPYGIEQRWSKNLQICSDVKEEWKKEYCIKIKETCIEIKDVLDLKEFVPCVDGIRKIFILNYPKEIQILIDMFKYPYEDEEKWIKEDISCQSLEDETEIKYCLETKKVCSEFIAEKVLNKIRKPFSTCVSKVRERLGMPLIVKTDMFGNEITAEGDVKINWATLYNAPFSNFEAIEERWKTLPSNQKLKIVRNILATGTTYDLFPDWMKNDPVIFEIKEELLQKSSDN
jgi:hypothetical protein